MTDHTYENQGMITYHKDGLLDIYIGFSLLTFGFGILTGNTWLGGVIPAVLVPTWISSRKSILDGRVHEEELRSDRAGLRMTAIMGLFALTVLAGLAAFAATLLAPDWTRTWIAGNFDLLSGLAGATMLGIMGMILNTRRLYAYALLSVIIFTLNDMLGGPLWVSTLALGTIMIFTGLLILLRFLSTHPRYS